MNPGGTIPLNAVLILCLLFSLSILLSLGFVIAFRLVNQSREKKYMRCEDYWDRFFLPYLEGDLDLATMPGLRKREMIHWERYLYGYLKNIRGRERERIGELCRHSGLTKHLLRLLQRGNRWEKARAARFLGALRETEALRYLRRNLQSRDYVISLASARGLAAIGDWESFHKIIPLLLQSYYTYEAVSEILVDFGEKSCPLVHELLKKNVLVSAYRQTPFSKTGYLSSSANHTITAEANHSQNDPLLLRMRRESDLDIEKPEVLSLYIDFLAFFNYLPAEDTLKKLMASSDVEEVVIHCLKALERIAAPEAAENVARLLWHENWVIRSHAARVLGSITPGEYLEDLHRLLSDENWWVRFRAGEALLNAGENGLGLLRRLSGQAGKSADMAIYMLERLERS